MKHWFDTVSWYFVRAIILDIIPNATDADEKLRLAFCTYFKFILAQTYKYTIACIFIYKYIFVLRRQCSITRFILTWDNCCGTFARAVYIWRSRVHEKGTIFATTTRSRGKLGEVCAGLQLSVRMIYNTLITAQSFATITCRGPSGAPAIAILNSARTPIA